MSYGAVRRRLPRFLRRNILHFESSIEDAVARFAAMLAPGSRVLDAGAGEGQYAAPFRHLRYVAVDLAIGDPQWDYRKLDCIADLAALPFPSGCFDACLNIVTLEHVREPGAVLGELARTMRPSGSLLLVVPQEWEVHQAPHDYFRYTRYGVAYLLERAGFTDIKIQPVGGYFRLLSRRLLNGLQFCRGLLFVPAALVLAPPALLAALLDPLDREQNFTLGYICTARKSS
jgi:SAM-dependent methyltransferase